MVRLKSIEIDGMHNAKHVKYEIGNNVTYFTGQNGSGKTTAMEAIQLALLGYIPGFGKQKSDTFKHKNPRAIEMSVTLNLDSEGSPITIKRVWTGSTTNIKSFVVVNPEIYDVGAFVKDIELPIFNFSEFLGLTANKLKDWFLAFLPSSELEIDWNKELRSVIDDINVFSYVYDEFIKVCSSKNLKGIDQIRWANDYFKQCVSFAKAEVDRNQKTLQSLVHYEDIDDSISDEEISRTISWATNCKSVLAEVDRKLEENRKIELELSKYPDCKYDSYLDDPRYTTKLSRRLESEETLSELRKKAAELSDKITKLMDSVTAIKYKEAKLSDLATSDGQCPYTKTFCESVKILIEDAKASVKDLNDQVSEETAKISQLNAELDKLDQDAKLCHETIMNNALDMKNIEYRYGHYLQLKSRIQDIPENIPSRDEDYDKIIEDMNDLKVKKAANSRYNKLLDTLTENVFKMNSQLEYYKKCVTLTGVNGLQNSASTSGPFDILSEHMDKYVKKMFGENVRTAFVLESKANSFAFGLDFGHSSVTYDMLSSGEKCMYAVCLLTGLIELSNSPVKLIMIDDLLDHLDKDNIIRFVESLYDVSDVQYIFAGVSSIPDNDKLNKISVGG